MKLLYNVSFIVISLMLLSCEYDLPEEEEKSVFEAPVEITVFKSQYSYGVNWSEVEDAVEYRLYLKSGTSQLVKIELKENNNLNQKYVIDFADFDKIKPGTKDHKFGVEAISYAGLRSKITWSETFN